VALTLDDGPCPHNSLAVLDVLKQHEVRWWAVAAAV
jgi:peptidoglycan/xylan/chitin deacetylase (PgdA/CDA1 family)